MEVKGYNDSVPGKCCACGYDDQEETECDMRSDGSHCNHWWDGPDE